ncbi:2-keto-4-pentenoate hydratase [Mycolicibacterium sp. HK-90]|uniref:2-keto-4-pentenoate hydratase n=1 Tax=Mycolicibacterium sp. HK-90 TaxID=3056937 RepID=UPI002657B557|nr:4-oxalocrotonate decarboxylase [Mycolicibacterium sp. HK-90]WKG05008.1 4-oxalocrotonate decarboxylase [Mycolicibacterium sp. HK-90]
MNIELSTTIQSTVDSIAGRLLSAQAKKLRVASLSAECRNLNFDLAYRIQDEALSQRIERGEHIVGIKVQSGSSLTPLTGWLTDAMALRTRDHLPAELLVHPGVEPVIAFVMGRRLGGPGVTAAAALAAVGLVFAGLEITDSRYSDRRCAPADLVADNLSSSYYLTGPVGFDPAGLDLSQEEAGITVAAGDATVTRFDSVARSHPAEALAAAANCLARRGHAIESGWTVLVGTAPVPLPVGFPVTARFSSLGTVALAC